PTSLGLPLSGRFTARCRLGPRGVTDDRRDIVEERVCVSAGAGDHGFDAQPHGQKYHHRHEEPYHPRFPLCGARWQGHRHLPFRGMSLPLLPLPGPPLRHLPGQPNGSLFLGLALQADGRSRRSLLLHGVERPEPGPALPGERRAPGEGLQESLRVRPAILLLLSDRALDGYAKADRNVRTAFDERRELLVLLLVDDVVEALPGPGLAAGEHLVPHEAETVDVAPAVQLVAVHLLRRHVCGGPDRGAGKREAGVA